MGDFPGMKPARSVAGDIAAAIAAADDVLQYANLAAFPASGVGAALYIAADTGLLYRWDGAAYISIGAGGGGGLTPITTDTTVTVPANYATIELALAWAKQQVVTNGAKVTIAVSSSYTITNYVEIAGVNAPWLNIAFDAVTGVAVDGTNFTVHPVLGVKPVLAVISSHIGDVYGKLVPTNVSNVMVFYSVEATIQFGNLLTGDSFVCGAGWTEGFSTPYSNIRGGLISISTLGSCLRVGAAARVTLFNSDFVQTDTVATGAVVSTGLLALIDCSITAAKLAVHCSNGGHAALENVVIVGGITAQAGGVVAGTITISTPSSLLDNNELITAEPAGGVDLHINSLTLTNPNLGAKLARASRTGCIKLNIAALPTGVSTGAPAAVTQGGTVEVAGSGIYTAFTGAVTPAVYTITADGLIRITSL